MADRIIKPDSGNDVVVQNNAGTRKIEVTNSGDVEVTGDFKATTVKATNLKANDGTAALVVADSTGEVTSSGGLKGVNVKTTNLKANDGTAGISIADSTGRVTFQELNPVITLGSNTTFPAGMVLKTETQSFSVTGTYDTTTNTSYETTGLAVSITPLNTSTKILVLGSFGVSSNSSTHYLAVNIYRSGSSVTNGYILNSNYYAFGRAYIEGGTISPVYIDNAGNSNTSDAITYTVHIKVNGGTGFFGSGSGGSITVCEIKA